LKRKKKEITELLKLYVEDMNKERTETEKERQNDWRGYSSSSSGSRGDEGEGLLDKMKRQYYTAKEKVADTLGSGMGNVQEQSEEAKHRLRRSAEEARSDREREMEWERKRDRDRDWDWERRGSRADEEDESLYDKMKHGYDRTKHKAQEKLSGGLEYIEDEAEKLRDKLKRHEHHHHRDRDERRHEHDWERRHRHEREAGGGDYMDTAMRAGKSLLEGNKPIDVVCVDGSVGADKAMIYALKNLPKNHSLLLMHGIYSPITGTSSRSDDWESIKLEKKYQKMCKDYGRECAIMHFNFTSTNDFGDRVCRYERYNNVKSVIIGRREDVSDVRRAFLGSSSQSVLNNCTIPVTTVSEQLKESNIQ